jgi:hypothetical protein
MFITSDAGDRLDAELAELQRVLPMTLEDKPEYFLGMNIEYTGPACIRLSCKSHAATMQANYADNIARAKSRRIDTPADSDLVAAYERALEREQPPTPELIRTYATKGRGPHLPGPLRAS